MAGWNPFKRKTVARPAAGAGAPAPLIVREAPRAQQDARCLPRFNTTASDQVSGRGRGRFDSLRAKLRHIFTPSQPMADRRLFAGRDDLLKTIIRSIEDQRLHIVLYGERGIGKTSLLHILTQAASEARYIVVYTSCGANSTFDDIFRAAAKDVPLLFHSGFSPTATESEKGASLADLLPAGPLTPRMFGDLCAKLTGTRVLIILDEFDRAESSSFRRDVAELMKNLSDRLGRVQLVLAGVAADLTQLVEHIPSIRRNIFALRMPKMTEAEVLQIIANGEREADLKFEPDASAAVVTVVRGSPYIASLLCYYAGHAALDAERNVVKREDVVVAVDHAVIEFASRHRAQVLHQVNALFDQGKGKSVAVAARAALAADGSFSVADLVATGELAAAKAAEIVNLLRSEDLLVVAHKDETAGEPDFAFVEEGLPTLIWMMWTQSALGEEPVSRKAAGASS